MILTKKDFIITVIWASIMASWFITINIFISILVYGKAIYIEPNLFILIIELTLAIIFGVLYLKVGLDYMMKRCSEELKR